MSRADYFLIGKITAPHGIKGEVRVLPITDEPARFALLDTVELFQNETCESYIIEGTRFHKNQAVLKLRGVDDRNCAERLRDAELKIPPEKALPLDDDEYYRRDLIGMTVIEEPGGQELGTLTQILETGANDVYVVTAVTAPSAAGAADGGNSEFLIPAIKQCILDVSVPKRRMTVKLMRGMRQ